MAVYRIGVLAVVGLVLVLGGEVRWGGCLRDVHTRMRVHTHVRMLHIYIYIRTHRLAGVDRTGGEERRGEGSGIQ